MKSKMKKLVSLVLAMAMVLTMSLAVYAAEVEEEEETTSSCDITINGAVDGTSYIAYKLLDVTISSDNQNYSYTVNSTYASILSSALTSVQSDVEDPETDVVSYLDSITNDATAVRTFADAVYAAIKAAEEDGMLGTKDDDYYTVTAGSSGATIENVTQGYYLVVETSAATSNDSVSLVMLNTAGLTGVEVTTKEDVPKLVKKVQDINDSTETEAGSWQDSADYDIDDKVPFQLTATLPTTLSSYSKYAITFHDSMDDGLTYDEDSVKVYVYTLTGTDGTAGESTYSSTEVASGYTVKTTDLEEDCDLEIVIADVNALKDSSEALISVSPTSKIVVEYTATLKSNAVVGNSGNWNTAYLEFSNNPYVDTDTSKTPTDTVVVLTYDLVVNKVDSDGDALEGATFKLEKYDKKNDTWTVVTLTADDAGTTFTATGLDDGVYKLTETKTPDGYNSIDPIYFIVTATHTTEIDSATEEPLTVLTYTQATWDDDEKTATAVSEGDATATFTTVLKKSEDNANLASVNIVNKSGSILPSTGGIGTTIFYIVGAILVLGAGVILVTRRRTRA